MTHRTRELAAAAMGFGRRDDLEVDAAFNAWIDISTSMDVRSGQGGGEACQLVFEVPSQAQRLGSQPHHRRLLKHLQWCDE